MEISAAGCTSMSSCTYANRLGRQSSKAFCRSFLGSEASPVELKVCQLPIKFAGLGVANPSTSSSGAHGVSRKATVHLANSRRSFIWQSTVSQFSPPAWTPALSVKQSCYLSLMPLPQLLANKHSEVCGEPKTSQPVLGCPLCRARKTALFFPCRSSETALQWDTASRCFSSLVHATAVEKGFPWTTAWTVSKEAT